MKNLFTLFVYFSLLTGYSLYAYDESDTISNCNNAIIEHVYNTVSNEDNTMLWNDGWIMPYEIPTFEADDVWGSACSDSIAWQRLYNNGACWVSDSNWNTATVIPETNYFKTVIVIPVGYMGTDLDIAIASDDSVEVFLNPSDNPEVEPWNASADNFIGGAKSACDVDFINLGEDIGAGVYTIGFKLINLRPSKKGMIYGIRWKNYLKNPCEYIDIVTLPSDADTNKCSKKVFIESEMAFPSINKIQFEFIGGSVDIIPPAGWSEHDGFENMFYLPEGSVPDHIIPGMTGPFTIISHTTEALNYKIIFRDRGINHEILCDISDLLSCDCCDNFDTLLVDNATDIWQIGNSRVGIRPRFTASPNRIIRLSSEIAMSWYRLEDEDINRNNDMDFQFATSNVGTLNGHNGMHGIHPSYSNELIFGDYNSIITTSAMLTGNSYGAVLKTHRVSYDGDALYFVLRNYFTDINCCTCDELIHYQLTREYIRPPVPRPYPEPPYPDYKKASIIDFIHIGLTSKDELQVILVNPLVDNNPSPLILEEIELAVEYIYPHQRPSDEKGNTGDFDGNKIIFDMEMKPGDKKIITCKVDNPKDIETIKGEIKLKISTEKDNEKIEFLVTGTNYGYYKQDKPESVEKDENITIGETKTIAFNLNNKSELEDFSKIVFSTDKETEILSIGSDDIGNSAGMEVIEAEGMKMIVPSKIMNGKSANIGNGESLGTVFITFKNYNENTMLYYEILNSENVVIAENSIDLGDISGIINNANTGTSVSVYPNPANNKATINLQTNESLNNMSLVLYDANGKMLKEIDSMSSINAGIHSFIINTANLSNGTYFIKVTHSQGIINEKLNVVR